MTWKTPFPLISVTVWLELVPGEGNVTSLTGFSLRGGSAMGEGSILGDSRPRLPARGHVLAAPTYPAAFLGGLVGAWSPRGGAQARLVPEGTFLPPASLAFPVSFPLQLF